MDIGFPGWSMGKFQVTLGELRGGIALLTVTLAITLPGARKMIEGFGAANVPRVGRLVLLHIGVIAILIQFMYWSSIIPLLRMWRGRKGR